MLIENKNDIAWLRAWGQTALQTVGLCCCQLPTFNHCFVEACGKEPSARVQIVFRQLAELNKHRMRDRGECIGVAEILATIGRIIGCVVPEPSTSNPVA